MKISACLITKNEEKNIGRCINSFKNSVDEIIVVDTGSTDDTIHIARLMGAKVFNYNWDNSFAKARNYALSKCKGDWIVFLDADEYFGMGTGNQLRGILKPLHFDRNVDALFCQLCNMGENQQVKSTCFLPRIFRNDGKIRYLGNIHETIGKPGRKLNVLYISHLVLKIFHTGYSSPETIEKKCRRNLELLLNELQNGKETARIHSDLADTYYGLKEYELAIKHARYWLIKATDNKVTDHLVKLYIILIRSMSEAGYECLDIIKEIEKGLLKFPEHPDLYKELGLLLFSEKRYSEALQAFDRTIYYAFNAKNLDFTAFPSYIHMTYYYAGFISELMNKNDKAQDYYLKSLRQKKDTPEVLTRWLNLIKNRHPEEIIALLNSIYDENDMAHLEFVLAYLIKLRIGSIFRHYYEILQKKSGPDEFVLAFLLLSEKKYDKALKYFYKISAEENNESVSVMTAVAALLCENENSEMMKTTIYPSLERIVDAYNGCYKLLKNEDINTYLNILNEFIFLNEAKHIKGLIRIKSLFQEDISEIIIETFIDAMHYEKALEQLLDILTDHSNSDLWFKAGFCFYKLKDYEKASVYMEKAFNKGYRGNDLVEFLCWIDGQCQNEGIKLRAKTILNRAKASL